eukprot:TRINITY_DN5465_c0_g1_i1.p1 TRINITY_DN5465_c0_g1~~TRINITY_DN5465_c0_g1_i1.p1  ORF type:complete len:304 (-),score=53.83 TRINITY_DN5465_c0_g1_i1:32-904(-)
MVGTRSSSRLRGQASGADAVSDEAALAEATRSEQQNSQSSSSEEASDSEELDEFVNLAVKASSSNTVASDAASSLTEVSGKSHRTVAATHRARTLQLKVQSLDSGLSDTGYITYTAEGHGKGARLCAPAQAPSRLSAVGGVSDVYNNTPGSAVPALHKVREVRTGGKTAGKGWFDMHGGEVTAELKRDIALVRMRGYLSTNRFYKAPEVGLRGPELVQLGTVIEGPTEYRTARLTKKQRRATIADELLADEQVKQYAKVMNKKIASQRQGRKRTVKQKMLAFGGKRKPKR